MDSMLTHTESLLKQVYWFKQDLNLQPKKKHIGSAIEWTDITKREHDFLVELVNTVVDWVYNKEKAKNIIDERLELTEGNQSNASAFLTTQAFSKFRSGYPQGQFGELLLFNFIQHFFKAVPLLRKQKITTSTGHERFGADAIHYKEDDSSKTIYLGEAKCYKSKYQFKSAFKTSLESIVNTIENFNEEMSLYTYDDFIEPKLEDIAKKLKHNELKDAKFELVCLVAYNETNNIDGNEEEEIKTSIKNIIVDRCKTIEVNCFDEIEEKILKRINYIIFPFWEFDQLLEKFGRKVGS